MPKKSSPNPLKVASAKLKSLTSIAKPSLDNIKLEKGEKLELTIVRSKLGLIFIWLVTVIALTLLTVVTLGLPAFMRGLTDQMLFEFNNSALGYLYIVIAMMYAIILLAGGISAYVYQNNYLYVTNKRLIHRVTSALFATSTNVIDLASIEDVSFKQSGIIDYIFRLGTIRMSTIGDETTYGFDYVDTPTDELAIITHLVHVEKEKRNKAV